MTKVSNNHSRTPIGLPDGTVIPPGQTVDVENWNEHKKRDNIKAYIESGHLSTGGAVELDDEEGGENESTDEDAEKDGLIAELAELGVTATKRSKVETLRAKLDEAKAAQGEGNE